MKPTEFTIHEDKYVYPFLGFTLLLLIPSSFTVFLTLIGWNVIMMRAGKEKTGDYLAPFKTIYAELTK